MSRYAIRGGHNSLAIGANGIVNEVTEDRKITASVIKWLKIDKNEVIDVTPYPCISAEDLKRGASDANIHKVDIFASIHLNAANGQGKGTEVLYYGSSVTGKALATRVCNSITKLGFISRGAKSDIRGLYELKHTDMPAIIVECFFCDSAVDVALYKKLGVDTISKAIAEGIVNHPIVVPIVKITIKPTNDVLLLQQICNALKITDNNAKALIEDGLIGVNTLAAKAKLKVILQNILK